MGIGPPASGVFFALPGIAADPARPGRLALAFYRLGATGAIDAYLAGSTDRGGRWSAPRRLNPEPMRREWLPVTQLGPMIGDYISTSFVQGRAIPIIVIAGPPRGRLLDESAFATVR